MMIAPGIVFSGNRLRVTHARGGGSQLLVTLDYRKDGRAGFGPPPKAGRLARRGWDHVHLSTSRNDWFLSDETPLAVAAILRLAAGFPAVHLLGYSMGGYGALHIARGIGAHRAVVVSPFVSLLPAAAPWETRHRADLEYWQGAASSLKDVANGTLTGLIVSDPTLPMDQAHARAIARLFPGMIPLALPGGGHPATRELREAGDNDSILAAALAEDIDGAALLAAHVKARLRLTGAGNPPIQPPS